MKKYLVLSFLFLATTASASSDCGTITGPEDLNNGADITTVPIEDCNDPFGVTFVPSNPYTLHINDTVVANNGTYNLDEEGETNLRITGQSHQSDYFSFLFKHTDDGYEYIDQSIPEPTHSDEVAYLNTYFQTESERTRYGEILSVQQSGGDTEPFFYNEVTDEDILDIDTGEYVADRFSDFLNSFYDYHYNQSPPPLNPGTYTLVFKEYELILNQHSFLQKLAEVIVPKAEASCDYCTPPYIYTITFTILPYEPVPIGASSVLFLPGIQASRLYVGEDGAGVEAGERVWEPDNNDEVRSLAMTMDGSSVNNVYSKDIIDSVTTKLIFGYEHQSGGVYKNISSFFEQLVSEDVITEWRPYAYDWRHNVFDLIENGTLRKDGEYEKIDELIESLAENSKSGKVTIIAHSNGGLLAKALMIKLQESNKDHLVDQIIFVGTPHYGTPKAIATILHGYDQEHGGGFVTKGEVAREIINNLPGAYALLPSAKYFAQVQDSIITFDISDSTKVYTDTYGNFINNHNTLQAFMRGQNELFRSLNQSLYVPASTNSQMQYRASQDHDNYLDNWSPQSGTRVSSIIGVGLPTLKSIKYQNVTETICNGSFVTFSQCAIEVEPRPFGKFSYFGDGTVMMRSADIDFGDEYFVDLKGISNLSAITDYNHSNMTETIYIQNLIHQLILSTTTPNPIPFITTAPVIETEGGYTIQKIASPVQISVTDSLGRTTGLVYQNGDWLLKNEIPNSYYFEMGGIKYLIIPDDVDFETNLQGDGYGGFSYYFGSLDNEGEEEIDLLITNATTTPLLKANLIKNQNGISNFLVDEDGDGSFDLVFDAKNQLWVDIEPEEENAIVKKGGTGSILNKPSGIVAGISTMSEEEYLRQIYLLLLELEKIISSYKKN